MFALARGRVRWIAGALAVGALAVAFSLGASRPLARATRAAAVGATRAGHPRARITIAPEAAWAVGTRRVYAVALTTRLTSSKRPAQPLVRVKISAKLDLVAVSASKEGTTLRGELGDVAFGTGDPDTGPAPGSRNGRIRDDLGRPFQLTVTRAGRVGKVMLKKAIEPYAENVVKQVAAALQFVRSADEAETWTVEEDDLIGTHRVTYRLLEDESYEKTKGDYVRFANRDLAPLAGPPRVESSARVRLDAGSIDHSVLREHVTRTFGDAVITSDFSLELRTLAAERLTSVKPIVEPDLVATGLAASSAGAGQPASADVRDESVAAIVARLRTLSPERDDEKRQREYRQLIDLFTSDPQQVEQAERELRRGLRREDQAAVLGALGDAETPEAQRALQHLLEDRNVDPETRGSVLTHFALADQPTTETVASLQKVVADPATSEEMRSRAVLSLGATAHAMEEMNPEQSAAIVEQLSTRFANAGSDEERANALASLGNSGSSSIYDEVRQALASPSPGLRSTAVHALRRVREPWADELLSLVLHTDPEASVRSAAASVAGERPLSTTSKLALADALLRDSAYSVRVAAAEAIGRVNSDWPEARALLGQAAANDPNALVQKAAKQALAMLESRS